MYDWLFIIPTSSNPAVSSGLQLSARRGPSADRTKAVLSRVEKRPSLNPRLGQHDEYSLQIAECELCGMAQQLVVLRAQRAMAS